MRMFFTIFVAGLLLPTLAAAQQQTTTQTAAKRDSAPTFICPDCDPPPPPPPPSTSGNLTWDTGTPRYDDSCIIPDGVYHCTVNFSWTTTNAPNATLWYYNLDLGTSGAVATSPNATNQPINWIDTHNRVFKLRASSAANSQVLAETSVITGLTFSSIHPTMYKGGTNYGWWKLGTPGHPCSRGSFGVIKQYNDTEINSHLAQMHSAGMRTIRIPLFYNRLGSPPGTTIMGLVPLSGGGVGLSTTNINNFAQLVQRISDNGFEQIVLQLIPKMGSEPNPSNCTTYGCASVGTLVSDSISLLRQVTPVLRSSGVPFYLDLGGEEISLNQDTADYARQLWSAFRSDPFFQNEHNYAYFSTIATSVWQVDHRIPQMNYIYNGDYPLIHDFHIYAGSSSSSNNIEKDILQAAYDDLAQNNIPRGKWIIGETFYNDALTADNIKKGILSLDQEVLFLTQWPKRRDPNAACSSLGVTDAPPIDFSQYASRGY